MNNKVCIFDIDNTLTHAQNANSKYCCIKDDNCMRNKNYQPAWPSNSGTTSYILETIKNCKDNGYKVAIATAESGNESVNPEQKKFINKLFNPTKIYDTPLYQNSCTAQGYNKSCKNTSTPAPDCCNNEFKDKTNMYINIMNHLKIPPEQYGNSIVFDDDTSNLSTANRLGFLTCQASQQCGGRYCDKGCGINNNCSQLPFFQQNQGTGIL